MNKHIITSLLIAGTISAPAFALKSITDMFKDPKIAKISFEMQSPAFRAAALEQITTQVETPFAALNKKVGDKTTLACEEEISSLTVKIFRAALNNKVQDCDYAALVAAYTKLYDYLTSKADVSADDINAFISLMIARRITVAGLEFSMENAGKMMTQQQQVQCGQAIQNVNDVIMEFMIDVMGLVLEEENEGTQQPATAQQK